MSVILERLAGDTWYAPGPTNVGIYRLDEREVCLIDSGADEGFARELLGQIAARGWRIAKIVCTHAHPDHIGGNRLLQKETGCDIFASDYEREIAERPLLMPSLFYGGSPSTMMKSPYFMAPQSKVLPLCDSRFPAALETLPLPGHTLNQIGVRTPDGVLFTADALAGVEMLERFHITFLYDVMGCLSTIDMLSSRRDTLCVPSHAPATADMPLLCKRNRAMIREIESSILATLTEPRGFDELLARLFERYHTPVNLVQYTLVGHTVRCYLSYLLDAGRIETAADGATLKWTLNH